MHLTAEQDGIYRRLIDYYMESRQPLPDNDFALARIAGVDNDCFKHASSILRAFFEQRDGVLNHKKCDELLDEQDSKSKFYAKRAKKAASIRHGKTKDLCLKHATSNSEAMLGDATITITETTRDNKKESIDIALIAPKQPIKRKSRISEDWVLPREWGEWAERQGLAGEEILKEAEKFRDRQISQGASYVDWSATWRNWIRNHIEWSSKNGSVHTKVK
jgi:uncharacterized protein YdaU (DUF1376 family)